MLLTYMYPNVVHLIDQFITKTAGAAFTDKGEKDEVKVYVSSHKKQIKSKT